MVIPLLLVGFLLTQSPPAASARQDVGLLDSAKLGDLAHARTLVANGAPVDARDWRGYTALMWASAAGHLEIVRFLLERGAQVDSRATDGTTALILASGNGAIDLVKLLLSRGANPAAARQGTTARQLAVARGYPEVARLLEGAEGLGADLRDRGLQPQAAVANDRTAPSVTASLQALDGLVAKAAASTAAERAAQKRAATALAQLRSLSGRWPSESPEDYRLNLAADVVALSSALARADQQILQQSLEAVADDLEAKLEHCRKSGGRLGGSVLVRVRTVQSGQEAGKWQVFYMPRIFEVAPNAVPDLFPLLSSPTEEMIVPGRYLMWVRNPATAKVGERTVVKVGEGRKELVVDLPVPVEAK
jgi:hypothetical protein